MKTTSNRIFFSGNPYPDGHEISKFIWSGRVDENQFIWFDFHLETVDYYAEDETEEEDFDEEESDWKAKIVWENYHSCKISSTFWSEEDKGIRVSDDLGKLNFKTCIQNPLMVDNFPLAEDCAYEDLAFDIYLLGHDSCANHRLMIDKDVSGFRIEWTGKIALTYSGDANFIYDFNATINHVKFDGFYYPPSWSLEKANDFFKQHLEDFEDFEFMDVNPKSNQRVYKLMRIEK